VLAQALNITGATMKTFSVGFKVEVESEKFNADSGLARRTAEYFSTDHTHVLLSSEDVLNNFAKLIWHNDEPNSNPTAAAIFVLAQTAKQKVDVVLGGDGGDELFGGYPRYYFARLVNRYQRLPRAAQFAGAGFLRMFGKGKIADKFMAKSDAENILNFLGQPDERLYSLFNNEVFEYESSTPIFESFLSRFAKKDFSNGFMYCDFLSWLKDESLARSDKMTMAHGLEQRVPILDNEMVDVAFRIPSKYKLDTKDLGKKIWIDAVKDLIPDYLWHQPKRGWFSPMAKWLRVGLKDLAYDHISALNTDYFIRKNALKMLDDHISKKQYNLSLLWALITWQAWYDQFIKKM